MLARLRIILAQPQLGDNIGMAARAMRNCGVEDLYLINPRDGWPNQAALDASVGASDIIERATLCTNIKEAVSGLNHLYALTARTRARALPHLNLEAAMVEIQAHNKKGGVCGVLFGPERAGLDNDMLASADTVVSIQVNPAFASINLAQAVMLVCYEWRKQQALNSSPRILPCPDKDPHMPADKEQLENFLERLEKALDERGFFIIEGIRKETLLNLRAFFQRARPALQELNTLHGIVALLAGKKKERNSPPEL